MAKNFIKIKGKNARNRRRRLKELTNLNNPTALDSEIAALRILEEKAFNEGNARLVIDIAKTIGTLSHNTEVVKIRRGELLAKPVVLLLAQKFAQLLADKIAGRFIGWEEVLMEVKEESQALIVDARNKPISEESN